MDASSSNKIRRPGQSIIEMMIAVGVFAVLGSGLIILAAEPLLSSANSAGRNSSSFLTTQGLEAARQIKDNGWTGLVLGDHGLARDGSGNWIFSGGSDLTDGLYSRVVSVTAVNRDGSGNITATGGTLDPRTKQVTVTVSWNGGVIPLPRSVSRSIYFTDWNSYDRTQTTDTDWNGGTLGDTQVSGSGAGASLVLANAATTWTASGGTVITNTTDADWNATGSSSTSAQVIGTGAPASVTEAGNLAWTSYFTALNWYETTNGDFIDGSFTNTQVVDTGDLGAVALDTSVNWAPKTSPNTAQMNDVAIYTAGFGFGVGNGGAIERWDGTSWATVASGVAVNLQAVAIVSPTDAWAVGGSAVGAGTIIHWNGSNWSSSAPGLTNGTQIFRDIHMVSSSSGWATADAGVIYVWNGSNWTAETSGTTADLNGVDGADPTPVPGSFSQTTDVDFNASGSVFNNTAVISGSGSVSLGNGQASSWVTKTAPSATAYVDVSMFSPTLGAAVQGTAGGTNIAMWTGTNWSAIANPDARILYSVELSAANDGWAVGDQAGAMVRWNGTAWVDVADISGWTTNPMRGVDCWNANTCMVVGYTTATPSYAFYNGSWGARTTITFGGIANTLPRAVKFYDATHVLVATTGGAIWMGTYAAGAWTWANTTSNTTNQLNDIDCSSATDCVAVGNAGTVDRWDGTTWTVQTSGTANALNAVDMAAANNVVAVGAAGTIRQWTGAAWNAVVSSTAGALNGIALTSTSYGFAVGATGGVPASTILEYNYHASWMTQTAPSATTYMDVSMFSPTFGTAVQGTAGGTNIAMWDGNTWTSVANPDGRILYSVKLSATNDGWAVGDRARSMVRWNGTSWVDIADITNWGNNPMYGVDCWNANTCMVVGYTGYYSYWNGAAWTARTSTGITGNPIIRGVKFYDATHVFVVAANGAIWRGTYAAGAWTWANTTSNTAVQLNDIDCLSATDCIAVGATGVTDRWNGATWTVTTVGAQNFNAVDMVATNNIYAVGAAGTIRQWTTAWNVVVSPTAGALNGIGMTSANFGVAVGATGGVPASTILEYTATSYYANGTYYSKVFDATMTANWGTLSWDETLPTGTNVTIATQTSDDNVTWSGWSAEQTANTGVAITSPTNQYIQYRATLSSTNNLVTSTLDSITLTYDTSTPSLFAVSDAGTILGRNGVNWTQVASFPGRVFRAIDCLSGTDCWAVADGGYVSHLNGTTWPTPVLNGVSTQNLLDVAEVASSFVVAVGNAGTVLKWNGSAWAAMASPTAQPLYGVAFDSTTFGAMVGANDAALPANTYEWDLHYATSGSYTSNDFDAGTSQSWSILTWDETLPGGTNIPNIVAWSSTDGLAWSSSVSCAATPCDISALANGQYFRYVVSETTPNLNRNITPRLNSITITYNAPLLFDYYDLYMTSPTNGWAAGCDAGPNFNTGGIARWDGTSWFNVPGVPSYCYDGIGGSGPSDVWADDFNGDVMLHWNGSTWTAISITALTGTSYLNDVKCLAGDPNDCRATGTGGLMLQWNGTAWSVENSGTTQTIEWVSYVAANNVWAAADGGQVLHYDGTAWSVFATYGTTNWHGIQMLSATDGWIVGGDGQGGAPVMRHWDGATWNSVTLPTGITAELQNVYCLNSGYCWASGGHAVDSTVVLKWNGASWSNWMQYGCTVALTPGTPDTCSTSYAWTGSQSSPLINTYRIKAAWADTATHAWSVANSKGFNEFKSSYPATATWTSPAIDGGTAGMVWNDIAWDSVQPPTTGITVATRSGPTSAPDGSWSGWSAEYASPGGSNITSPANRYLQYRVTFTSGNLINTARLDEVRIVRNALTAQPLYALRGVAAGDLWTVGGTGFIGRYNGTAWAAATSPVTTNLRGLAPVASNNVYAVGSSGRILNWNGTGWCTTSGGTPACSFSSPTNEDLFGADAVDASHVWAVGTNGAIVLGNGNSATSTWAIRASNTTANLRAVDMVTVNFGMAVGDGGVSDWWNGTSWSPSAFPSGTSYNLNGISCYSTTSCFAVGDNGTIIRWDGTGWTASTSPVVSRLNAVAWNSASQAWAVGDFGTVLKWDGTNWINITSPTTRNLYDVNFVGTNLAWICGDVGSVLELSVGAGSDGAYLSAILDMDVTSSLPLTVYWSALTPPQTSVSITARDGNTITPDAAWNNFSFTMPAYADPTGSSVGLPAARYLQYRATLSSTSTGISPSLDDITFTYR